MNEGQRQLSKMTLFHTTRFLKEMSTILSNMTHWTFWYQGQRSKVKVIQVTPKLSKFSTLELSTSCAFLNQTCQNNKNWQNESTLKEDLLFANFMPLRQALSIFSKDECLTLLSPILQNEARWKFHNLLGACSHDVHVWYWVSELYVKNTQYDVILKIHTFLSLPLQNDVCQMFKTLWDNFLHGIDVMFWVSER